MPTIRKWTNLPVKQINKNMPSKSQNNSFAEVMSENINQVKVAGTALDAAIDWIVSEFDPGDIYPIEKLKDWAESNGYVKE